MDTKKRSGFRRLALRSIVVIVALWLGAHVSLAQNPPHTPQLNTDYFAGTVVGWYPSIQSAVSSTCTTPGARVVIPAAAGVTDTIGAVTGGCTKVSILDRRVVPELPYVWNGSAYIAVPYASGSVSAVTVVPANGVSATVANQGTTPALTFTLGAITPSSAAVGGTTKVQSTTPATSSLNQASPSFFIGGTCWNGTTSVNCGAQFSLTPATSGVNPAVTLNISAFGTTGQFGFTVPFIATSTLNVAGQAQFFQAETVATSKATSSANFSAGIMQLQGSFWNGTAATPDSWGFIQTLGTGANPTSNLLFSHSGSTGFASITFGGTATGIIMPSLHSVTGQRILCVDTAGTITAVPASTGCTGT